MQLPLWGGGRTPKTRRPKRTPKPSRTKPSDIGAAERAAQALELRLQGTSYREIGKRLNVCSATAYTYVAGALSAIRAECIEKAGELHEVEIQKLDRLEIGGRSGCLALLLRKSRESLKNSSIAMLEKIVTGAQVIHVPSKYRFEYASGSRLVYGGMHDEK